MANLVFKGHKTRGKELHKLLKNLGGVDCGYAQCCCVTCFYYINREGFIEGSSMIPYYMNHRIIMSLETFESKYPYKVGDKVIAYAEGCLAQFTIQDMRWNHKLNKVEYKICSSWLDTSVIQPYKEETMDKVSKTVFDANAQCCDISNKIIKKETMGKEISGAIVDRFICLEGYDFYDDKGNIIETKEITMKKKPPKYPKTYEECCKVLRHTIIDEVRGYKADIIELFQKLLICRDAYWKIAGDWKPEFRFGKKKYCIITKDNKVVSATIEETNRILVFPTEEMRNAFYENFKELIEECKELS